jgi:uncharacterized membrane protein
MATIEQSIEIDVPCRTAYNQWTQFEDFPKFMEGVKEVRQLDDTHLLWRAEIAGRDKEWEAEITEQRPDERIAWTSRGGVYNAGAVTFHRLSDSRCKAMLQLDYQPEGAVENVGDALGVVSARVRGDLQRFKAFIESRGRETGAWRGEVEPPGRVA